MNLREIMTAAENEIRHYPDLAAHRIDLRAVVNRVYKLFWNERQWSFTRRRVPLWAFPDLTVPNADVEMAAGWGVRTIQLPSLVDLGMMEEADASRFPFFSSQLAGAELDLADPTLREAGGGDLSEGPYTIEGVPTLALAPMIQLDPRADISSIVSGMGDLVIRFPRILLPADVGSVISLTDPQGRPLPGIMPGEARRIVTAERRNQSGTMGWFLEDFGSDARLPTFIDPSFGSGTTNFARSPFFYERETWPMRETLTLEPDDGTGTFLDGTLVRVFACWFWGGRFGPPSAIAEVTTESTGSNLWSINVTGFPQLPTSSANIEYGRRVAFFVAEGEGAFFLRGFDTNPAIATFPITDPSVSLAANLEPGLRFARWDEVYPGGPYQYLRIWPRPTAPVRLELDYYARPRELVEDTDSPEFPAEHEVLVWLTVASLLGSPRYNGDPTSAYVMAEQHRQALMSRHYPQDRYPIRRGQVDRARAPCDFFIGPDIDYVP